MSFKDNGKLDKRASCCYFGFTFATKSRDKKIARFAYSYLHLFYFVPIKTINKISWTHINTINRTRSCEGPLGHRIKQPPRNYSGQDAGRVSFSNLQVVNQRTFKEIYGCALKRISCKHKGPRFKQRRVTALSSLDSRFTVKQWWTFAPTCNSACAAIIFSGCADACA